MNKNTKWIVVAILIIIVIFAGCIDTSSKTTSADKTPHTYEEWRENGLTKITIPEDNVTCYIVSSGISCLKDVGV